MSTLHAPKGGRTHLLSEKFYEGGQFMPEPDKLGSAKRKAAQKAGPYHYNAVFVDGRSVFVKVCVRFIPSEHEPRWITRNKIVFTAQTEADAIEIANSIPQYGTGL